MLLPQKLFLCIDGLDGVGKNTVSSMVMKHLQEKALDVVKVSPPFYDTPSGQLVSDYLTNGYGDIRDRRIASLLYSVDRDMYYRNHMCDLLSGPHDVVIFNRNWLSNLFYQTTPIMQSTDDALNFASFDGAFSLNIKLDMTDILPTKKPEKMTYWEARTELANLIASNSITEEQVEGAEIILDTWRELAVCDMIDFIYRVELEPWKHPGSGYPFTAGVAVCNLVLTPTSNRVDILRQNMAKRSATEGATLDRNEQSDAYLASVAENIDWISKHWPNIRKRLTFLKKTGYWSGYHQEGLALPGMKTIKNAYLKEGHVKTDGITKAFFYNCICTVDSNGEQRTPENICDEVLRYLRCDYAIDI